MSEDSIQQTGAVRSSDANHLDFCSIPLIGLIGVARTAHEGGEKYGRYNYMKGFPAHDLINHALRHQTQFLLGDRSEPHLEHACWGLMAAIQSLTLNPELSAPHLLGPGATIPPAMESLLNREAPDRAFKRKNGFFAKLARWLIGDLPEVRSVLASRKEAAFAPPCYVRFENSADEWADSGDQYRYTSGQGLELEEHYPNIADERAMRDASASRNGRD